MPDPTHYPMAPSNEEGRCRWCGFSVRSHGGCGAPFFCSLTCSWQFATFVVWNGVTIDRHTHKPTLGEWTARDIIRRAG